MARLFEAFKQTSILFKFGFVVVVVVGLAFISGGVGGFVSHYKDKKFDRIQAAREAEIDTLSKERNEAIGRAEVWEARAKELEADAAISEAAAKAAGAKAETAKAELEKEDERYKQEMAAIGDDVDTCTRLMRICERAKRLGLYPKTKVCDCSGK